MDLRDLPTGLDASARIDERRARVEKELGADLSILKPDERVIGNADEKNCEQMIGVVPVPVGIAGPLKITLSSKEIIERYLPLATTEGALVASVNRGCKAVTMSGGATVTSIHHGTSRSIAFKRSEATGQKALIEHEAQKWLPVAESTSSHLKVLHYELDETADYVFLTLFCDTDEAMGMNMVTIAAQAVGEWIEKEIDGLSFVTVAANVDSDKKPSVRTHDEGRGFEVNAEAVIPSSVITEVLKTTPEKLLDVARAKLEVGSALAGAIGKNLHAANIIAALYLATGQDAAHVVEGSLTDTTVEDHKDGIRISVRIPALMIGLRGGGTDLPAQAQALGLLLGSKTSLHPRQQLAEIIGSAVLAGEISLLAAQASGSLAKAHATLGRSSLK